MGSLASRAQPWPRARPAYVAHARSSRTALAHQADRGAQGVILTVLSTKGTSISCGSGACVARARPVSAPPTMTPRPPRPSSHHSACAPAAHSPLHCARLFAAQYREADRQHQHHWRQGRRSLLRRCRLGPRARIRVGGGARQPGLSPVDRECPVDRGSSGLTGSCRLTGSESPSTGLDPVERAPSRLNGPQAG